MRRVLQHSFIAVVSVSSDRRHCATAAASIGEGASSSPPSFTIFRRELADGNVKSFPLSVDIPQKKLVDLFNDFESKRCKLCNESYMQWNSHVGGSIPHVARESVMLEMVRAYCGTPEELVAMWRNRLDTSNKFRRIQSLSHQNAFKRKRRLQYLLAFLRDKHVLRECFNVNQHQQSQSGISGASAARSFEFERLEWVGDNVVKYLLNNRINELFPYSEGGIRGRLGYMQFMMDGNDGLARAYDHLELQKLTNNDRVVSKFKSDVVETLFGELQLYLWSTQMDVGASEPIPSPFTPEMIPLRELVYHVLEEAGHCIIMYHIEYILENLMRTVNEHQVIFVRADPALQNNPNARRDLANAFYGGGSGNGASGTTGGRVRGKLQATKTKWESTIVGGGTGGSGSSGSFNANAAAVMAMQMSSNYDAFRLTVPLGGLLPRPFAVESLTPTVTFLPQAATVPCTETLKSRLLNGEMIWSEGGKVRADGESAHIKEAPLSPERQSKCLISSVSLPSSRDENSVVSTLKQHGLIPSL